MKKTQKTIYYVLLALISIVFLFSGYSKVTGNAEAVASFAVAGLPIWFMYFIGICEILGAIGLWIRKLQEWTVYGLSIILLGAIVLTAIYMGVVLALFPLVVLILIWITFKLGKKE